MQGVGSVSPQPSPQIQQKQQEYGQKVLEVQQRQQDIQGKVARGELTPQEGEKLQQDAQQELLVHQQQFGQRVQQIQQSGSAQSAPAPTAAPTHHGAPFTRDTFEAGPPTPTEYRYSPPQVPADRGIPDDVRQNIGDRSGGGSKLGVGPPD